MDPAVITSALCVRSQATTMHDMMSDSGDNSSVDYYSVVLACLLEEFGPSDTSRVPTRQKKKMDSSSASILRDAQCGIIEVDDEEGISVESEEEDPTWSVEEDDEENTSQQSGYFRFSEMEVSKEKPTAKWEGSRIPNEADGNWGKLTDEKDPKGELSGDSMTRRHGGANDFCDIRAEAISTALKAEQKCEDTTVARQDQIDNAKHLTGNTCQRTTGNNKFKWLIVMAFLLFAFLRQKEGE